MTLDLELPPTRGAYLSPSGRYRYLLWREWGSGPRVCFVMLNPSTADAEQDDPTLRRCIDFAKRWGYGGLSVVNLFAWRATDPAELPTVADPIGPENDFWLRKAVEESSLVVAAWGTKGGLHGRDATVRTILRGLGVSLHWLRLTKDGHPEHPLYLPGSLTPKAWVVEL